LPTSLRSRPLGRKARRAAHTDVWMAFVWCLALIAVFAPLAVARYRRVAAR
jgi:hypothetical protein